MNANNSTDIDRVSVSLFDTKVRIDGIIQISEDILYREMKYSREKLSLINGMLHVVSQVLNAAIDAVEVLERR